MAPIIWTIDPASLADSRPLYSHASIVEGPAKFIYTAGQIGVNCHGVAPSDYEGQVRLAFENLRNCLSAAKATPKDIVKLTYYIVNYDPTIRTHAKVMVDFLGGHRPATTLVPVPSLARPDLLFEVEAVAAISPIAAIKTRQSENSPVGGSVVDVIVVGAGLSGLQAANDIENADLSCIILEARNRVGGKVWTQMASKGVVDLGAAWTNDTNQLKVYKLARRLDLEFIEQTTDGECVIQQSDGSTSNFPYGSVPQFSHIDQKDCARIRDLIESLCHIVDIRKPLGFDDLNLEDFVKKFEPGTRALSTLAVWTRAMLGCEPSQMSALYFLDYCKSGGGLLQMRSDRKHGGQYLRIKTGMGSLAAGLASMLKPETVILNSPVESIAQGPVGESIVTTRSGKQYRCKKVIVSLPTPLYKDIAIPCQVTAKHTTTTLGYYAKMILLYEKPWWRESNFCGLSQSFVGPASITRDTSNPSAGHYSLTCFIVGDPGRAWSNFSKAERQEQILSQVATIFGSLHTRVAKQPVEIFEQEWAKDEWSKGCPCPVMPPNTLSHLSSELRAPFGDIHFIGTETAYEWKGYMEGALSSGERGAQEVIAVLGGRLVEFQAKI